MLKDLTLNDYINFVTKVDEVESENEKEKILFDTLSSKTLGKLRRAPKAKEIVAQNAKFLKEMEDAKNVLHKIFELNGIEFGFIPDLENLTLEEVVDADIYLNDVSRHNNLMSILFRPVIEKTLVKQSIFKRIKALLKGRKLEKIEKYTIKSYSGNTRGKVTDSMLDMPLDVYFGCIGFFEHLGKDLQNAFPSYFQKEEIATKTT